MLTRRPVIALVASMLLWAPSFKQFLAGAIDVDSVCTRFLVAFAVAYVGVTILGIIVAGYGADDTEVVQLEADVPRRRRSDFADPMVTEDASSDTVIEAAAAPLDLEPRDLEPQNDSADA